MEVTKPENLTIDTLRDKMIASIMTNLYTASKLTKNSELIIYDTIPTSDKSQREFFWRIVQLASGIFKVKVKVNCSLFHYITNFIFRKPLGGTKVSWLWNRKEYKPALSLTYEGIINSSLFLEDVFNAYQDTTTLDGKALTIEIFDNFQRMEE